MKSKQNQELKVSKKVQYAIRMLLWHSDLAKRYSTFIKKWLDTQHLDYDIDLMQFLTEQKKKEKTSSLQTTIYDFIEK